MTKGVQKRSALIAGHRTSFSLEDPFWEELKRLSVEQKISLNQLVAKIDAEREGNLSSALRLYILAEVKNRQN